MLVKKFFLPQVNEFLAGAGTDAPDVEEENIISRPSMSYDDMWAKTLLESSEMEVMFLSICLFHLLQHRKNDTFI